MSASFFGSQNSLFLSSLLPKDENIIPPHNTTQDCWVEGPNLQFNTQWVTCSYPVSGNYGWSPRYIFYGLILFTISMRKAAWIGTAALGSVMTYSATAAIHGVVLFAIRSKIYQGHGLKEGYYMEVLVEGVSESDNTVSLPVLPMVWDGDTDAALAITGTAFLTLLPMQYWSKTFQKSSAKGLLLLWSGLLLIGSICGLIDEAYLDFVLFPQLRFCPPEFNDTLPLTNSGSDTVGMAWDGRDTGYWNTSVYDYFGNSSALQAKTCLYPCFGNSWPLRDSTEIVVDKNFDTSTLSTYSNTFAWLNFAVYLFVGTTALSGLTTIVIDMSLKRRKQIKTWAKFYYGKIFPFLKPALFVVRLLQTKGSVIARLFCSKSSRSAQSGQHARRLKATTRAIWDSNSIVGARSICSKLGHIYLRLIDIYAKALSPFAVLFFIGWIEWVMWTSDFSGETFRHIGQWGAVVAALLVIIGAFLSSSVLTRSTAGATPSSQGSYKAIPLSTLAVGTSLGQPNSPSHTTPGN